MASDAIDTMEPVIVSSNRYLDIKPYCHALLAEDEMRWMSIMPFDFPTEGTQEDEEAFLREYFSEREIRMQGGADGDGNCSGNGFRFLKQVWHCLADWNMYDRVPRISAEWFEKNQELLNDPRMRSHMLSPEVRPSTFFETSELAQYGEKLLGHVIQDIQGKLAPPEQSLEYQRRASLAARAKSLSPANTPVDNTSTFFLSAASKRAVSDPKNSVVASIKSNSSPSNMPLHGTPTTPAPQRMFSSEASRSLEPPRQPQSMREPHMSNVMSRSSADRAPHQQAYGPQDVRYYPQQYQQQVPSMQAAAPGIASAAPFQHQGQSAPFVPENMPFMQPMHSQQHSDSAYQLFDNGQPVFPPNHPHYMQGMRHGSSGYPTPVPMQKQLYVPPQILDRTNYPAERSFSNNAMPFRQQDDQRRDSVMSLRGSKNKGPPGGRHRPRGKTGSFGHADYNRGPQGQQLFNPYDNGTGHDQGRFVMSNQAQIRSPMQQQQRQNENANPNKVVAPRKNSGQYHRKASNEGYMTDEVHTAINGFSPEFNDHSRHSRKRSSYEPYAPCGCSQYNIGMNCNLATRLVIFRIPVAITEAHLGSWASQFGEVAEVFARRPHATPYPGQENVQPFATIRFADVDGARRALSQRELPWPGGDRLMIEVSQEHCDPDRRAQQNRKFSNAHMHNGPNSVAPFFSSTPMYAEPESYHRSADNTPRTSDPKLPTEQSSDTLQGEPVTSPTQTGPGTPRKGKNKKSKAYQKPVTSKSDRKDSGLHGDVLGKIDTKSHDLPGSAVVADRKSSSKDSVSVAEASKTAPSSEESKSDEHEVVKSAASSEEAPHTPGDIEAVDPGPSLNQSEVPEVKEPTASAAMPVSASKQSSLADTTEHNEAVSLPPGSEAAAAEEKVDKPAEVDEVALAENGASPSPEFKAHTSSERPVEVDSSTAEIENVDVSILAADDTPVEEVSKSAAIADTTASSLHTTSSAATEMIDQQAAPDATAARRSSTAGPEQVESVSPKAINDGDSETIDKTTDPVSTFPETDDKHPAAETTSEDKPKPVTFTTEVRRHSHASAVAVPSPQALASMALSHSHTTPSLGNVSNDTSEVASKTAIQVNGQRRTVSDSSAPEDPGAFVTAPSTPLILDPTTDVISKKELKKELKEKGPAQTESLSLFFKPNKKKLKKGGSVRGRSLAMTPVYESGGSASSMAGTPPPKSSEALGEVNEEQLPGKIKTVAQAVSTKEESTPSPKKVADSGKTGKKAVLAEAQDEKMQLSPVKEVSVSSPSSRPGGIVGTVKALLGYKDVPKDVPPIALNDAHQAGTSSTHKMSVPHEQHDSDNGTPVSGLGISNSDIHHFPAPGTSTTDGEVKAKKKKKKSKAKKQQGDQATAEITKMDLAVVDSIDPSSTPIHEYRGNDQEEEAGISMGPPRIPTPSFGGFQILDTAHEEQTGLTTFLDIGNEAVSETSQEQWSFYQMEVDDTSPPTLRLRSLQPKPAVCEPETPLKIIDGAPDVQETSPEVEKSRKKLQELQEREEEMKRAAAKKSA